MRRVEPAPPGAGIAMDVLGQVLFWIVGAAISIAIALAILWFAWSLITRARR